MTPRPESITRSPALSRGAVALGLATLVLFANACGKSTSPAPSEASAKGRSGSAYESGASAGHVGATTRHGLLEPWEEFPPPPMLAPPFDGSTTYGDEATPALRSKMDRFVLDYCPLCSTRLGTRGETVVIALDGREVRLCSGPCHERLDANLDLARRRIDAPLIADQASHYPLDASLIDGQPLGESPVDFIWGNRHFRAHDDAERRAILADPLPALRTLDSAVIRAQRPGYGMPDTCPVQGPILENEARIDLVVANRMVRVCCERCARMVHEHPSQYLSLVEYANRAAAESRSADTEDDEPQDP